MLLHIYVLLSQFSPQSSWMLVATNLKQVNKQERKFEGDKFKI